MNKIILNKDSRILFLGDSITEGCCVEDYYNRYDNILKRKYNLKEVYNYGIGGTRLAHQSVPSENPRYDLCFCGRAHTMNDDSDIIVVYGGVNDYIHGDAPIGKMGDKIPSTFHGGVYFLMKYLKNTYKDKTVVFMTPAHCNYDHTDAIKSERAIKLPDALPLVEYVKIIEETAKAFDIPVLNLFERLPIDPNIPEHKEKYTTDGLHFNNEGQIILANTLIEFLKAL
jgi:hypothetical protein